MSLTPPPGPVRDVPVGATVIGAYRHVFGSLLLVFKAAAVPFAILLLIGWGSYWVFDEETLLYSSDGGYRLSMLYGLLMLLPLVLFAFVWHRVTLLGTARARLTWLPRLKPRDGRFFAAAFALVLLLMTPGQFMASFDEGDSFPSVLGSFFGLFGAIVDAAIFLAFLLFVFLGPAYLLLRFSFIFPALAVGERYGFRHAWTHTRGQVLRLLLVFLLSWYPGSLFVGLAENYLDNYLLGFEEEPPEVLEDRPAVTIVAGEPPNKPLVFVISHTLGLLAFLPTAFFVSAVSIAFRDSTGWVPPIGPAPPTSTQGDNRSSPTPS